MRTLVVKSFTGEIDCPNLLSLDLGKYSDATFSKEKGLPKVKHLSCYFSYDWIRRLSSLETLSIRKITHRLERFLVCFPSLKWMCLRNAKREALIKLVDEREHLSRFNLGIYYRGFAIKSVNFVVTVLGHFESTNSEAEANNFDRRTAVFYLEHGNEVTPSEPQGARDQSGSIPNFQFFTSLTICDKLKELNRNFFRKFPFLGSVHVTQGNLTQDELIAMLKSLSGFQELNLDSVSLTQLFFDQIPSNFPHLMGLCISNNDEELENIAFINQLPRLCSFKFSNYRPNANEFSSIFVVLNRRKNFLKLY